MPMPQIVSTVLKTVEENLSGKPQELIDAEKFYVESLEAQRPYHRTWFQNIAAVMGLHYMQWNNDIQQLRLQPKSPWRVRLTVNLILPVIRNQIAKVLRSNPWISAVPSHTNPADEDVAKAASKIFKAKYYEDSMQRQLFNLVNWMFACGNAYLWALFDPTMGQVVGEAPVEGAVEPTMRDVHVGEVVTPVSGPFDTMLQPGASENFDDHRKIMRIVMMHVEEARSKYRNPKIQPETLSDQRFHALQIQSLVDAAGLARQPERSRVLGEMVLVKSFFERPSDKFAAGRESIHANGELLDSKTSLNYFYNRDRVLPVGKFDDIVIPGRAQAQAMIEQLLPINQVFNRLNSKGLEDLNMMGRPKVLSPKGAIPKKSYTDEPGEILEYTPIGAHIPKNLPPPEQSQSFMQFLSFMPQYIKEVSGIFDASLGKLPRRATSGKALDILQEADDTRMETINKNFSSSLQRTFSIALGLMQTNYNEERIAEYVGKNRVVEILKFKGADLAGISRIYVEMRNVLSRGQRERIGLQLAEMGAIPADMAIKIMDTGNLDEIFDQGQDHVQYARLENMELAKGIAQAAAEFEDHKLHISWHGRFLNSPIGRRLPPEIQQLYHAHIKEHTEFLQPATAITPPGGGEALPEELPEIPEAEG